LIMLVLAYTGMETHVDATAAMSRKRRKAHAAAGTRCSTPFDGWCEMGHLRCADDGRADSPRAS
jgi:hypothetical protein